MTSEPAPATHAEVLLDVPIAAGFDYLIPAALVGRIAVGDWVEVPWGTARRIGIVASLHSGGRWPAERIRPLRALLGDAPRLPAEWLELGRFAASYYHRQPGEILLAAIPKLLRAPVRLPRKTASVRKKPAAAAPEATPAIVAAPAHNRARLRPLVQPDTAPADAPALNPAQARALDVLQAAEGFGVHLLHGVTGSGKTEVYLRFLAAHLRAAPEAQVLMLVPEIALTPQLAAAIAARLPGFALAVLHSGMSEGDRATHWLAAAEGRARVVLGTRLSVFTPLPHLRAIVVDEEHDPSFKQREGAHYSARDLAVMLARTAGVPIVLGSATPSLETWHAAAIGRYQKLQLPARATGASTPEIRIETLRERDVPAGTPEGLTPAAQTAIAQALARGEQVLVFLNRRGYAPVIGCAHCGWLSECDHCSAWRVLHRQPSAGTARRYALVCHHCGAAADVPRACPGCGNLELQPIGRGTQRLEEILATAFPQARIGRLDADVARRRGAAKDLLDRVHGGEVDIVVGTQMLAKGHDFKRLNLVVVLDPDGALFSADFRAPERLYATLAQVAGRAGRHAAPRGDPQSSAPRGMVIVQTRFSDHPVFRALVADDFERFADQQLEERRGAGLPPFSHQALIKAEADDLPCALEWLRQARAAGPTSTDADGPSISIYDPVPMPMARIADRARAQLLVESASRPALHRFLGRWMQALEALPGQRVRWQLEVDPQEI